MATTKAARDNHTVEISALEWKWINDRLIDLEVRLTLATAWMHEKGTTRKEVEMMGIN